LRFLKQIDELEVERDSPPSAVIGKIFDLLTSVDTLSEKDQLILELFHYILWEWKMPLEEIACGFKDNQFSLRETLRYMCRVLSAKYKSEYDDDLGDYNLDLLDVLNSHEDDYEYEDDFGYVYEDVHTTKSVEEQEFGVSNECYSIGFVDMIKIAKAVIPNYIGSFISGLKSRLNNIKIIEVLDDLKDFLSEEMGWNDREIGRVIAEALDASGLYGEDIVKVLKEVVDLSPHCIDKIMEEVFRTNHMAIQSLVGQLKNEGRSLKEVVDYVCEAEEIRNDNYNIEKTIKSVFTVYLMELSTHIEYDENYFSLVEEIFPLLGQYECDDSDYDGIECKLLAIGLKASGLSNKYINAVLLGGLMKKYMAFLKKGYWDDFIERLLNDWNYLRIGDSIAWKLVITEIFPKEVTNMDEKVLGKLLIKTHSYIDGSRNAYDEIEEKLAIVLHYSVVKELQNRLE